MRLAHTSLFVGFAARLVRGAIYERFEDVPTASGFDFVIVGGRSCTPLVVDRD